MSDADRPGTLYVVATPIGNLEDITLRAIRVLKEVVLIAAEDTRHSRKLLQHYGISTPLTSYHEHNEEARSAQLLERLRGGESLALISDAGTPAISDPGYTLVRRCRDAGLPVVAVPGPSALTAALSVSGLPVNRFAFEGFLPTRAKARRTLLGALAGEQRTLVFYESPRRLTATLRDLVDLFGAMREIAIARELTKVHEELFRGPAGQAVEFFGSSDVRGEIVLMVAPAPAPIPETRDVREQLLRLRRETDLPPREIVKRVARQTGLSGSEVYRESLKLRQEGDSE